MLKALIPAVILATAARDRLVLNGTHLARVMQPAKLAWGDQSPEVAMMGQRTQKFLGIQYLRAVAVLMVVFFHIRVDSMAFDRSHYSAVGAAGVDIFFVISGFIMAATSAGLSTRDFLIRRVIRIVPLYWLFTTVWSIGLALRHKATFGHYVLSLLFVPFYNAQHHGLYPLLVPGWTLNYEMVFYLVFGALLFLPPLRRLAAVAGLFAVVVALGAFDHSLLASFYANPIILEFAVGMALADTMELYGPVGSGWGAMLMTVAAFALLSAPRPENRLLSWGGAAAAIVFGSILVERAGAMPKIPPLVFLGDASYAIYLTHVLAISGLAGAFRLFGVQANSAAWPFIITCAVLAVGLGAAVHLWLELPITARLRAIARRPLVTGEIKSAVRKRFTSIN